MRESSTSRRDTIDLLIVQVLSTSLTLPILAMFSVRLLPPAFSFRVEPLTPPSVNLGFALPDEVVMPTERMMEGLGILGGVALALALLTLAVGCATAASLVQRAGIARREELGVRAAVGATRGDLRALVIGPLLPRLAVGAAVGTGLGMALLWYVRSAVPEALVLPQAPLSSAAAVAVLSPVAAAWLGARLDLRAVLRRFASPLTLESTTRLNPLVLGGAYFGLLVGLLATVAVLANSHSALQAPSQEWSEVADTLLFEVEAPGAEASLSTLAMARAVDPESGWHLVSAGALEGLGPAARELVECDCVLGEIVSPYTRLWGQRHSISPGAFAAVGMPIMEGREFTPDDGPENEGVAILEADHRRSFPGVSPVGKRILISGQGFRGTWYRVVGIVDAPKPHDLATASQPIPGVYLSALQHPPGSGQLVVPIGSDGGQRANETATTLQVRAQGRLIDRLAMWSRPFVWFTILIVMVSAGAFVLGIYGVTTLTWLNVRSRTSEFGVRRAVGARTRHIRLLVLREVFEVAVVGAALGSILGRGLTVGLADRFRAIEGVDPTTLVFVAALLGVAAALAARRPARRAAAIAPIEAIGESH